LIFSWLSSSQSFSSFIWSDVREGKVLSGSAFFVGNQRNAEAFGFLMLNLKKCGGNEDQTAIELSPSNCGGIA
jgi:hypothetical protein